MDKKITMKDIARESGVSASTVCRVITNNGYPVKEEVRKKVIENAEKLGYKIDYTGLLNEVALMIPTTDNLFYASLAAGAGTVLEKEKYCMVIYSTDSGKDFSDILIQSAVMRGAKGIIVASAGIYGSLKANEKFLREKNIEAVLADCPTEEEKYSSVFYNYKKGAELGTNYLINCGHRKIVYAGLPMERESRIQRVEGFKKAIENKDVKTEIITYKGEKTGDGQQTEAGYEIGKEILEMKEKPTAVFAMNDMVAFGILKCFRDEKVKVPEDISVLGFDDNPFCDHISPSLSTVKVQPKQMGRMAAMLLTDKLKGINDKVVRLSVEPSVIERETVKKI